MSSESFQSLIAGFVAPLAGRPLDARLAAELNGEHGPGSPAYEALFAACLEGVSEGWMCAREAGGIRYGRVVRATPATRGFSVDVVDMQVCIGPHHAHPQGEIDLVMPLAEGPGLQPGGNARFDGRPAGWVVYGPGSAHRPTVSGGRALVLYLLPDGAIQFSQAERAA